MTAKKAKPKFSVPDLGQPLKRRPARVGDMISREIATLLVRKLKDPRLLNITITGVDMSPDLKNAKVYFGCGDDYIQEATAGLASAHGFIRSHLASALSMRFVPMVTFVHDLTMARHEELERLFLEIENERKQSSE